MITDKTSQESEMDVDTPSPFNLEKPPAPNNCFTIPMIELPSEPLPEEIEQLQETQADKSDSHLESDSSSRLSIRHRDSVSEYSVNWQTLEQTEEEEQAKEETSDESTALLLARLDEENDALAVDPKSATSSITSRKSDFRPMSIHQLKKMVDGPQRQSLRYSLLPPPPMTELEFWAALVKDYSQTAHRLPTLTSNKIRGGVPPPLRGVVWPAIACANNVALREEFEKLAVRTSPYDGLIGKDVGRSFPGIDMFREKDGEGQRMMGRVLRAFSLYDEEIGYCQGLGFVVGPLLMHMSDADAFCVLVRLMEHYDLRSCYLPDLSGLHLRIYQFQSLLATHLPDLSAHLANLKVEPLYLPQWFLSFFAVTCPLPMLLRIYDVILCEGATETLMRVALSLMQRNEAQLMTFTEFEDAMQFLLSRSLWEAYEQNGDELVGDFVACAGLVSKESLNALELSFKASQEAVISPPPFKSGATSFWGRFWPGSSHSPSKSSLSLIIPASKPIRKTSSSHSLSSAYNSSGTGGSSESGTASTDLSDETATKELSPQADGAQLSLHPSSDRDLHHQIEELLTAMNQLQRQQVELAKELQAEREQREADRTMGRRLLQQLRKSRRTSDTSDDSDDGESEIADLMTEAGFLLADEKLKKQSLPVPQSHMLDAASSWKEKHDLEVSKCQILTQQLDEREAEQASLRELLREARASAQESHRERQRLERTIQELRVRSPTPDSASDVYTPIIEMGEFKLPPAVTKGGLREFKLGRSDTQRSTTSTNTTTTVPTSAFAKRTSSLTPQGATTPTESVAIDVLTCELAQVKTAEAVARQELEETKGKLEALRKILCGDLSSPAPSNRGSNLSTATAPEIVTTPAATAVPTKDAAPQKPGHTPSASTGGFFSIWGRKGAKVEG